MRFARRIGAVVVAGLLTLVGVAFIAWGGLALWFDGPASRLVAGLLVAGFVAVSLLLPLVAGKRGLAGVALVWVALLGWWLHIPARADRDWLPDVAQLPARGSSATG